MEDTSRVPVVRVNNFLCAASLSAYLGPITAIVP